MKERGWLERYQDLEALISEEMRTFAKEVSFRDQMELRRRAMAAIFSRLIEGNDVGMLLNALGDALEDQNFHHAAHRVWSITGEVSGPSPVPDHVEVS